MGVQTVKFKGEFDVSQIMNSIKQMRTELAKQGSSPLFGNLDKEISKLEGLGSTIQAQIGKGFASTKEFKAFEANISKLELEFQKLGQSFDSINGDNLRQALKNVDKQVDEMKKKTLEMANAFKSSFSTNTESIANAKKLTNEIVEMAKAGKTYEEAQKRIATYYEDQARQQKEVTKSLKEQIATLQGQSFDITKSGFQKRQFTSGGADINAAQLAQVNSAYEKSIKSANTGAQAWKAFQKEIKALNIEMKNSDLISGKIKTNFASYKSAIDQNNASIKRLSTSLNESTQAEALFNNQSAQMASALERQKNEYNAAANAAQGYKDAEAKVGQKKQEHQNISNSLSASINNLKSQLNGEANALRQSAAETGNAVKAQSDFNMSLDSMKSRIAYVFSIGNAYYQLRRVLQNTLEDVKNIDKAFASIAMVTDKTISGLWGTYEQYAQMAQKLGQSTESAIKASALFYQQGLKDAEVMQLTEDTMKLATLANLDFEKATSQMTAALRGFHMEMDQGAHVTDVYSELAAHAAADVNGIAYAMSKTASIANNAGMSFENTAAFLTQMIETTQEAPENIGTAMKTIIARFTELKKNIAGTAESEFEDLDYNKVDAALKSVGVSLKDTNGQFRNLDEVFMELSEKWNTLDRNSQRYIATIAAGSRQQSRFIAMMEDYDRTMELVSITQDAEGRSNEQFAKNAESLSFKIQELKTAWEQFRMSIADSKFFKNIVDLLKNFINTLNSMDKKQIIAVATIGITLGKSLIKNFIDTIKGSSGEIQAAWKQAMGPTLKERFSPQGRESRMDFIKSQWTVDKTQQAEINTELSNYDKLNAKLREQEAILKQIHQKKVECVGKDTEEYNVLMQQGAEQAKKANEVRNEFNAETELINKKLKDLGIEENITRENREQVGLKVRQTAGTSPAVGALKQAGSSALSAGITTALMLGISGADFGTVIKTAGISALTAAIPSIIQAIMPTLISFFSGPAGIIALIAGGAIALTAMIVSESKKAEEAERERLENVKKLNEEIDENIKKTLSDLQKTNKKEEKINKDVETINTLNSKKFLNSKEEKELQAAVDELNSIEDGLVEFDEVTGHYKIVEDKMDDILEAITHEQIFARGSVNVGRTTQIKNINDRALALEKEYLLNIEGQRWKTTDQAYAADLNNYTTGKDMYGNDYREYDVNQYYLAGAVKEFLDQVNDRYKDYDVHLDEYFGGKGLEEILNERYPDASAISQYFEDNDINAQNINDILNKIYTDVSEINSNETKQTNAEFTRNVLQTQGWDEATAAVAKYMTGFAEYEGTTKGERIYDSGYANRNGHLFAFGDNKDFLTDLKEGNWDIFGANADLVEKLFTEKYEVSNMSDLFSSGTNFKDLGDMGKFGEALKSVTSSSDWNGTFGDRKTAKKEVAAIKELLAKEIVEQSELLAQNYQATLDANKDNFVDFIAIVQDTDDKTWSEYSKGVQEFKDKQIEDVKNAMSDYLSSEEGNIYKAWSDQIAELTKSGISSDIAGKLDYKTVSYFTQQIKDLNLSTNALNEYVGYINSAFKNLDSDILNILANIDLSNINNLTTEETQKYVDLLAAVTGDVTTAQNILNDYIAEMSRLTMKAGQGRDQANLFIEVQQQNISGYAKQYETLLKAQEEYQEKSILSEKTYFELKEAGLDKYVKISSKGYELLGDMAEIYLTQRALEPLNNLRKEIENQDAFIQAAEKARSSSDNQRLGTHTWLQDQRVRNITGKVAGLTDADLIKIYKEDIQLFEEIGETWKLDSEYLYGLELAARNGAESLSKFIDKAAAYRGELAGNEEQIYIQSLISLKSAYEESAKSVQDLKDKLDDLNDTLQKNKESLEAAEQKLYEAIHGTELFQSSLDGLFNYNNKLQQTNNIIEDLKDNLQDINSVDNGVNILSNLSGAYDSKQANLTAQNVVINDALQNLRETIQNQYGRYGTFNGEELLVDFSYLDMDNNDELKKSFEKLSQEYYSYLNKRRSNDKELKSLNKEREQTEKDSLKNYVNIQKDVINILKEQAKEEVDITKDKYDALKEADDDYISALEDAIQKQRDLRDKENAEDELAQKEKKLSLMQRDTSGSNAKDIQKLENDIEQDRQKLLDDNIDALINNMREVYEKQAETRDAEIDYMESVTENAQYFSEWAKNIMDSWNSVEDMQDWFLTNDKDVEDMSVEQTELYINDIQDKWKDLITYQSLQVVDFKANTDNINAEMTNLYQSTSENISNVGTNIQAVAEKAAQDAIDAAQKTRDEAQKTYDDTVKKIQDAEKELKDAEGQALTDHKAIMEAMVDASKSGMKEVSIYAVSQLAELKGVDLTDKEQAEKFAVENNWKNDKGQYSESFRQAVANAGGDLSDYEDTMKYKLMAVSGSGTPGQVGGYYNSKEEAEAAMNRERAKGGTSNYFVQEAPEALEYGQISGERGLWALVTPADDVVKDGFKSKTEANEYYLKYLASKYDILYYKRYKKGGLANYTGPAWVDGTPSRPEAFLDAEDTERFMTAAELFAMSPLLNSSSAQNAVSSSVGDTSIEININVESISDDYDVDRLIKRVEDDINETARPVGTQVILNKRV